jgi:hypothetical protein
MALVVLLVGDEKVRACDGPLCKLAPCDGKQTPSSDDTTYSCILSDTQELNAFEDNVNAARKYCGPLKVFSAHKAVDAVGKLQVRRHDDCERSQHEILAHAP